MSRENTLGQRRTGILLPVTALPDMAQTGVFDDACRFIDWLADAGVGIWQILPMGPPHNDGSPYLALSSHAGNPDYIGLSWLADNGLIAAPVDTKCSNNSARCTAIDQALQTLTAPNPSGWYPTYAQFLRDNAYWLDEFSLFSALREEHDFNSWLNWPSPLRDRVPEALDAARTRLAQRIRHIQCQQFLFFQQWQEIHRYAQERNIIIFGDMPLFVAFDSADVWANRRYFQLHDDGSCRLVAGVPPDYFSSTGQRWGNPHYNWSALEAEGFQWWIERIKAQLTLYDWVRIDHFRGLQAVWEIDAEATTASQGRWRETPGRKLLSTLHDTLGELPLIAEDLGLITPEVTALKEAFHLPGMAVLQFAFDSDEANPYLPHNLSENTVIYTGTHDNDTTLSWFQHQPPSHQQHICQYLGCHPKDMPEALVDAALASIATWAIIPLQDILKLGTGNRTNTPGTTDGNWSWHFHWSQLPAQTAQKLNEKNRLYARKVDPHQLPDR